MSLKSPETAEQIQRRFSGPMSEVEVKFLQDMRAYIEYAIRNGVSFPVAASALTHDLNEILRDAFNIDRAMERGFWPNVSGYAEMSESSFGAAEPTDE